MPAFPLNATAAGLMALLTATGAQAALVNGSFESSLLIGPSNFTLTSQTHVPGWRTTALDGILEIWQQPGTGTMPADDGTQFAELNANFPSTLYQDITGVAAGARIGWGVSHRGRSGVDTMHITITDLGVDGVAGGADDTVLFTSDPISDGATAWGRYAVASNTSTIIALGHTVRLAFTADSSTLPGGLPGSVNLSYGNLLDAVTFSTTNPVSSVPEPASRTLALAGVALLALAGLARRRPA